MTELLPNLGGEEGPVWRSLLEQPAIAAQRSLWRLLFPADTGFLRGGPPPPWPDSLGPAAADPVFPWLEGDAEVFPWIATEDAATDECLAGRRLAGPSAAVVAGVHDKAFAHRVALEERLVPPVLRGCIEVLDPEFLRGADAADRIEALLSSWPEWARASFTLKPRVGTSGRGRVAGASGRLDRPKLGGALERLAERGGALLEPWLDRVVDLSVQLHVGGDAGVTLLGSLVQDVSSAGVFLGHRGEVDSRGRVFSGHPEEEQLRESAALLAVAARERGFAGPCGVDAFEFRDPESRASTLRPVVEFNARFTAGTVTVGLVRRLLPRLKAELGLRPGDRMGFRFWLNLTDEERERAEAAGRDGLMVEFGGEGPATPALLFSPPTRS